MADTGDDASIVPELPGGVRGAKLVRGAMDIVSGAIPFFGGILSAISGAWSEKEQDRINAFFDHWLRMQAAGMREQQQTILEIGARIDMKDEEVAKRVESPEYQALIRKAFRDWGGAESEQKRIFIRNILSNAAAVKLTSDDVIRLFLDWIKNYSELHFAVIGAIYNSAGITRAGVWLKLGRKQVREDSSDADLYRLIFHDLSTGRIVRQHREKDYAGNFFAKKSNKPPAPKGAPRLMKSSFDDEEQYELSALGQEFVHYAMTDLPPKLEFTKPTENARGGEQEPRDESTAASAQQT